MKAISYVKTKGHFWFRLFGRGFSVKDTTRHSLMFSERNGYAKGFQLGKYYFKYLKNYHKARLLTTEEVEANRSSKYKYLDL